MGAEVVPFRRRVEEPSTLPPPNPDEAVPPPGSAPAMDWRWQQGVRWALGVFGCVVFLLAAVDGLRILLEAIASIF